MRSGAAFGKQWNPPTSCCTAWVQVQTHLGTRQGKRVSRCGQAGVRAICAKRRSGCSSTVLKAAGFQATSMEHNAQAQTRSRAPQLHLTLICTTHLQQAVAAWLEVCGCLRRHQRRGGGLHPVVLHSTRHRQGACRVE